jgi:hypothetical protein
MQAAMSLQRTMVRYSRAKCASETRSISITGRLSSLVGLDPTSQHDAEPSHQEGNAGDVQLIAHECVAPWAEYPQDSPLRSAHCKILQLAGQIRITGQHHAASSLCSCVEPAFFRVSSAAPREWQVYSSFAAGGKKQPTARI